MRTSPEKTTVDPRYIAARETLLDALNALKEHQSSLILAGAQAVYLQTGPIDIGIAPYTTDGDLIINTEFLGTEPQLETAMVAVGFQLLEPTPNRPEPGIWIKTVLQDNMKITIPVDLIVPEGIATGGGRRGARLGPHGKRAARRCPGLEATLIDHAPITISALDPSDNRTAQINVAGAAALIVAKAHKLHDRLSSSRSRRVNDKDAVDVYRLMQTTSPTEVGATLKDLCDNSIAGPATTEAISYFSNLFSQRNSQGIKMATAALRLSIPESQITTLCISYTNQLLTEARSSS